MDEKKIEALPDELMKSETPHDLLNGNERRRVARRRFGYAPLLTVLVGPAACSGGGDGEPMAPEPPAPLDTLSHAVGWSTLSNAPVAGDGGRHDDIFFLDDDRGWLVNTTGEVHGTEDGGQTWTLLNESPDVFNRSVGFASSSLGWMGNLNGFNSPTSDWSLFETQDGGTTWANINDRIEGPESVGVCGIWVSTETTVYGVGRWNGPAIFIRTRDGGQTWDSQDLAPAVTGLVDVFFFDEDRGLILGGRGVGNSAEAQNNSRTVIMGTEDGGDTWDIRYEGAATGSWGWKFSFPAPLIGYAAVQGPMPGGIVLKTTDGGQTWNEFIVDTNAGGFSGIGFANSQMGWIGADGDVVYQTTDGAVNWELVTLGTNLNRFRFLSGSLGFASGGSVYKYEP